MVRTRGLVLRRRRFGESSDVVIFLGDGPGLVSFSAMGRRRLKSRMGAALEPLSFSEVVLYERRGDLWLAKEARLLRSFGGIVRDLERFKLVGRIFGAVESSVPAFGKLEGLLPTLLDFLSTMETCAHPKTAYAMALYKLLELLGQAPALSGCASCGSGVISGFSLESGAVCEKCEKGLETLELSARAVSALRKIARSGWDLAGSWEVGNEALWALERYARYHLSKSE